MLLFLQSNLLVAAAGLFALLLISIRTASSEKQLRRDLRGAIFLLVTCLLLWAIHSLFHAELSAAVLRTLEVGWMLTFAFACIRTGVALALWIARMRSVQTPKILRDVIDTSLYTLAAIPILKSELQIDLSGLLATSAIVSVVLGMALQETLGNFFAGLSIQIERPFMVGDIVEIQDEVGKVMQVAWRATRLENSAREVVSIPNSILSKERVRNFTRGGGPAGTEVKLGLSYDAPPNRVKRVLLELLTELPAVLQDPDPSIKLVEYADSAIVYRIRFYCASYYELSRTRDEFLSRLWYRLRREKIEIPFPQRTFRMVQEEEDPHALSIARRREILRSVDLFSVLTDVQCDSLAEDLVVRHFGDGERVIEAGATGNTFYVVAEGSVSVMAGKPAREVVRLRTGQYFGEMSLLTGEPRSATVVAAEDALLLELDRPTFARLFSEHPDLAHRLSDLLAQRRTELRAMAQAAGAEDTAPEATRILSRLRQIFSLGSD